jgi:hypothetical protein
MTKISRIISGSALFLVIATLSGCGSARENRWEHRNDQPGPVFHSDDDWRSDLDGADEAAEEDTILKAPI